MLFGIGGNDSDAFLLPPANAKGEYMWKGILFFPSLIFLAVILARRVIKQAADGMTFSDPATLPAREVALVLGCAPVRRDGSENMFFRNRMTAAVELFQAKKVQRFLLSGDNRKKGNDEPAAMKQALMAKGVPEEIIDCDDAGLNTFTSLVRAREVFGLRECIVVSQEFHNQRAIYIATQKGLDAVGFNAAAVGSGGVYTTTIREALARVKALLDVAVRR